MGKQIIIFILALLLISPVFGAVIGVSPSIANFPKMLRQGYAEMAITVSTSYSQPIKAVLEKQGEIADWMSFNPVGDEFVFSANNPYVYTLIVEPPIDAQNGNYSGQIKMKTQELATVTSGAGSSIIAQVILLVYVEVTGEEIIACRAGALSTTSAEINDPFRVRMTVNNDGNVRLRPNIQVNIYNQYQTQLMMSTNYFGEQILPTKNKYISQAIQHSLDPGQYFAEIYVKECDVSQTTTFDIVNKGEISDSGELVGIKTNDISYEKEPLPIVPMFRNSGNRKVVAQFKGEIRDLDTDKVVQLLESDSLEVNPDQTIEFQMYYIPSKKGQYQISGRVIYNNKITFEEKSKVIEVRSSGGISWILLLMLYFIIGLVILILIGKIRKEKKRKIKW